MAGFDSSRSSQTNGANLRLLAAIRCILVAGQSVALLVSRFYLELELNYPVLVAALLVLLGLAAWILLRNEEASSAGILGHLLADIVILTIVLYYTGGSTNPFVSYYLVPLTISAAILPWRFTWMVAGLSLALYTLLLFVYQPLEIFSTGGMHGEQALNAHIVGMWVNFIMSALLITYFVVKMANQLRERDEQLHRANEDRLRDEQIMSLATMAAGTAHELGTPLATVAVLLNDMRNESGPGAADPDDIDLMIEQVDRCKATLRRLVELAESGASGEAETIAADDYLSAILDQWRVTRPAATASLEINGQGQAPELVASSNLSQAITNLLNNAAEASSSHVTVELDWSNNEVLVGIHDDGDGIDPAVIDELGKPFVTTKSTGMGVGLFLADAAIRRSGGGLQFENHPQGGAIARVQLPLSTESN